MTAVFSIQDLAAGYGGREVLHGVSFELEAGQMYGLIGPNGSGKTTLLDLMLASLVPTKGEVRFQGRPVTDYGKAELARRIALVPQDFRVDFDFTVGEVVMMGRHPHLARFASPGPEDRRLVDAALAALEIVDLQDRLVTQLSGGEKQRVVVARALAQDTQVLILDEATSNLDIQHSLHILQVLKRRCRERQCTIVAAIHDLNFAAAYCDRILLLDRGRLAAHGPPPEVLQAERLRAVFAIDCQPFEDGYSGAYQLAYRYE